MILAEKYKSLLNKYQVNTPLRLAHFFAQIDHESGLKPIEENLNYSAEGLCRTFKKYFSDLKIANNYARKPELIANLVYSNRMGNGNNQSGDGWRYRGRGFIQITGKFNYIDLSADMKSDYVSNPDRLLTEADAMLSALWFWNDKKLNLLADKDDILKITKIINGGKNGLEHRQELLEKYKKIF